MPPKTSYTIPKNKCQWCYNAIGRFVLDCYCIVCENCFEQRFHLNKGKCHICQKPTTGKFFDGRTSSQAPQIANLFSNVQQGFNKVFQIYRFQQEIANRYCKFLQNNLARYKMAIDQLITLSPQLQEFFNSRLNVRDTKTQKRSISSTNRQLIQKQTVKPSKTQKHINYGMVSRQIVQPQAQQKSDIGKKKSHKNNQNNNMKDSRISQVSMYSKNSNQEFFGPPNNFNYGSSMYANQAQKNFNRVQSKQLYNINPNQKKFSAKNPKVPYINLNTAQKSAKSDQKRSGYKNYQSNQINQKRMYPRQQNFY